MSIDVAVDGPRISALLVAHAWTYGCHPDIDGLVDLLRLARDLDAATQQAVDGLRSFGYSWADIAARLGTSRQADQQPWGR